MSSITSKLRNRHAMTQFGIYMNYAFCVGHADPRLHEQWFHITLELDSGQAGVETVQKCLKYGHVVVAMKKQQ